MMFSVVLFGCEVAHPEKVEFSILGGLHSVVLRKIHKGVHKE
jgi:hypothetical protein